MRTKILLFAILVFGFVLTALGQSRTNTLRRPCSGSTTAATVTITSAGNITATPCTGGTTTITGGTLASPTFTGAFTASRGTFTQGSITTSQPFIDHTATWNAAGVTFTNFKSNVTDTASAADSLLMDLQVGGTSKFKVDKDGDITVNSCTGCGGGLATTDLLRSYLSADVTYNNTATLADTALSVTVAASGVYAIDLSIYLPAITMYPKLDFSGTATITNFVGEWNSKTQDSQYNSPMRVTSAGTDYSAFLLNSTNGGQISFKGTVEVNAGGTFLVRGAQNTANASNTTFNRGSTLILTKLN